MLHLLAYGEAPGRTPNLHVLLTYVQTGPLALAADASLIALLVVYGVGVARLRRRGRSWRRGAACSWAAGVLTVWVAVGSGLAAYDEVNVSLHVVQHILLMMVAAPLLALGRPVTLAAQASGRRVQARVVRAANGHLAGLASHPVVTTALYYGTMWAFFLTPAYAYAVQHRLFHDATHLVFLLAGYLYWQPVVGGDPSRRRLSHVGKIVTLLAGSPVEAILGVVLGVLPWSISPVNTVAETNAGGHVFLIVGMLVSGLWVMVVGADWVAAARRDTARDDRRAQGAVVAARRRLEAAGAGASVPEGWWVPEWRLQELEALREAPRGAGGGRAGGR